MCVCGGGGGAGVQAEMHCRYIVYVQVSGTGSCFVKLYLPEIIRPVTSWLASWASASFCNDP